MALFKGKYRIESARLARWDYSSNGGYFITICVANRCSVFGDVKDKKMALSQLGKRAADCWQEIPVHFPFVKLDEFVIMPNHVHGIIFIDKPVTITYHVFIYIVGNTTPQTGEIKIRGTITKRCINYTRV